MPLRPRRPYLLLMISFSVVVLVGVWFWQPWAGRRPHRVPLERVANSDVDALPFHVGRDTFVTSQTCLKCHPDQHQSWHKSYHRTMTQPATPQTVVAPFDDVKLESRGRSYHLQRFDNEFWITMADPRREAQMQAQGVDLASITNPRMLPQKVVLTTGSHIAQTYWVSSADGLWQVPWVYHIADRTWIPNDDSFLLPPDTGRLFNRWNSICIKCHTTGPIPGLSDGMGIPSKVAELGISCEACHGSGAEHVRFREGLPGGEKSATPLPTKDPITNPARCSPALASQVCAQCHSSHREPDLQQFLAMGSSFRPGDAFEKQVEMHRHGTTATKEDYAQGYWDDGTCRTGGDEYLGLIASRCHQSGKLSCLSCHSMHSYASNTDQLKTGMDGNQACLQCHTAMKTNITAHTHHAAESTGSQCFNCHMPHVTYALFKGIRSHRIDSPSAKVGATTGRPTACNLCHLDKSLEWTAKQLTEWYSQPPVELDESQKSTSSTVLMALQGDAAQRVIAAWHLGWEPARQISREDWQAPILAELLNDPYSVVRYVSYRSLQKLPGFEAFTYDPFAAEEVRQKATAQVLEMLRKDATRPPNRELENHPLAEQAESKEAVIQTLIRKRDNRPIMIPE